jgi:hypothetical protein
VYLIADTLLLAVLLSGFALAQTATPVKPVPAKPAPAKPVPAKTVAVAPAAKPVAVTPVKPVAVVPAKPAVVQARPAVVANTNTVPVNANQPVRNVTSTAPVSGRPAYTVIQPAGSRAAMTPANTRNAVAVPTAATVPGRPGVLATAPVPAVAGAPAGRALPATMVGGTSAAGGVSSYASNQRGAVTIAGTGSFVWGDWMLVAYGCYRTGTGTRVLCDFDASKQNGVQANVNQMWQGLNLVDGSGRVVQRHSAFFLGDDGSQFDTGYVSATPIRMFIEYDDVSPNVTSATLVQGQNRVQGVAIQAIDPNAPPGAVPARAAAQDPAQAQAAAPAGTGGAVDKAQQGLNGVNNQISNVNDKKAKAKGMWDQLKNTMQTPSK